MKRWILLPSPRDHSPRRYPLELLQEWPVEALLDKLKQSMGEAHRKKTANLKVLCEQTRG